MIKLLRLFKKKEKKEDNLDCDLDTILSLDCIQVNPQHIHKVVRVLQQISTEYSESKIPSRMLDTVNTMYIKQTSYKNKFEKDLREVLMDFARTHNIDCTISIETDVKLVTKAFNEGNFNGWIL